MALDVYPKRTQGYRSARWLQMREAIETRIGERLLVADLAREVFLSPFHFAREFHKAFGMPPHAYITGRRMAAAKRLLETTRMPLSKVARTIGYSTHAHFCGVFKREVGATPRDYRRGVRHAALRLPARQVEPARV